MSRHIREILKDGLFFVAGKCISLGPYSNDKLFEAHLHINQKFKGIIQVKTNEDTHTYKVLVKPRYDGYKWILPSDRYLKLIVRGISKHTDWKYVE